MNKKILIIGPDEKHLGGISEYIKGLISSDLENDYKFIVFDTLLYRKRIKIKQSKFSLNELWLTIVVCIRFMKILSNQKMDIIHAHTSSYWGFFEKILLCYIAKGFRKKIVLHIHGANFVKFSNRNVVMKILVRLLLFPINKVICVSDEITQNIGLKNTITIQNSVFFPEQYSKNYSKKTINFCTLSVIEKRKRIDLILKAVKSLVDEGYSGFHFLFGGDGPETNNLMKYIDNENLNNHVTYLGKIFKEEKDKFYKDSDVYISASLSESFGLSIVEAMGYGLAVISTKTGVGDFLLKDHINGFLIKFDDALSIADSMRKILEKKISLEEVGNLNRSIAINNYSWKITSQKLARIYQNI